MRLKILKIKENAIFKKLLNPISLFAIAVIIIIGSVIHICYGNCQTTKFHYMTQCFYMHKYFPKYLLNKPYDGVLYPHDNYSGAWKTWDRKGIINEDYNCKNGNLVGGIKHYFGNGHLRVEGQYAADGSEQSIGKWIFYYVDGKKRYSKTYTDKPPFYIYKKKWHKTGMKKSEEKLIKETSVGIQTYFDKDGIIIRRMHFDLKGELLKRESYKDGKLIDKD